MNEYIKRLNSSLNKHNALVLYVGGSVRDIFVTDRLVQEKDIDLLIFNMDSSYFMENIPNDLILKVENEDIETYTSQEFSNIDIIFTGKITNHKLTEDIILDYQKTDYRDLTINSLYQDVEGKIYDSNNYMEDIKKGIIDYTNFKEFDSNKINYLRALMFSVRFDFTISKRLDEQLRKQKNLTKESTANLVSTVLTKGLLANPQKMYGYMLEYGILEDIFKGRIKGNKEIYKKLTYTNIEKINNKVAYIWMVMVSEKPIDSLNDYFYSEIFRYGGNSIHKYIKHIVENYELLVQDYNTNFNTVCLNLKNREDFHDLLNYLKTNTYPTLNVTEELIRRDNYLIENSDKVMSYVSKNTLIDLGFPFTKKQRNYIKK